MATCTLRDSRSSSANTTSYASNAFVPGASELLVVFVIASNTAADGTFTVTDSQSLNFTRIDEITFSGHYVGVYVANAFAAASSMTVTFTCASDAATGCGLFVYGVAGMSNTGSAAVVQFDSNTGASSTTPTTVFAGNALTGNPTLAGVGVNAVNPAGLTPPTSWTEPTSPAGDIGWATPTFGAETVFRDSGFTGTTITWGAASGGSWGVIAIELDATAAAATSSPPFLSMRPVIHSSRDYTP